MVQRDLYQNISKRMYQNKVIVITGARQTGKTTLLKKIKSEFDQQKVLTLNCDEPDIKSLLEGVTSTQLKNLIGSNSLILIDEAQKVENIGLTLKLIVDNIPDVQVIATGSSAFELRNRLNEPLTGRKFEYRMYPFSTHELVNHSSLMEEKRLLENRMIFGMYPDVVNHLNDSASVLHELTNSYLYKDILMYKDIRNPDALGKILMMLALQVGSEVSYYEIARSIGLDKETVERYIDLLEKVFVVFKLNSFSRNIRNELKKSKKIYFFDNGVRNAIINNFQPLAFRTDTGALWENFMISERRKMIDYNGIYSGVHFWRTHAQQEIDYIEERDGILYAFELKWNERKTTAAPASFMTAYPDTVFQVVTPSNYMDFLL